MIAQPPVVVPSRRYPADGFAGWRQDANSQFFERAAAQPLQDFNRPGIIAFWMRRVGARSTIIDRIWEVRAGATSNAIDVAMRDVTVSEGLRFRMNTTGAAQDTTSGSNFFISGQLLFAAAAFHGIGTAADLYRSLPHQSFVHEPTYNNQTAGTGAGLTFDGASRIGGRNANVDSNWRGDIYAIGIWFLPHSPTAQDVVRIRRVDPREWDMMHGCVMIRIADCPGRQLPLGVRFNNADVRNYTIGSGGLTTARPITLADMGLVRRRDKVYFAEPPLGSIFPTQPRVVHEVF